jgi:hypothetical protein
MNWQKIFLPIAGAVLIVVAFQGYGWPGALLVVTGIAMYLLLHFNRLMHVLRKASDRPKGYVASAVMLNAKLKPNVNLLHVMALTNSLGEPLSTPGEDPETYRWTDEGASSVTCEFAKGRLVKWTLERPSGAEGATPPAAP